MPRVAPGGPEQIALQRALDLLRAGQLPAASQAVEALVARQPRFGAALNLRGAIAMQQNDPATAARWFARAVEADKRNPVALSNLAAAELALGQADAAVDHLNRAARLEPRNAAVHYALGVAHGRAGRPAEAEASYRRAVACDPAHAQARNNLALTLAALGRAAEAEDAWRNALSAVPEPLRAPLWLNLGNHLANGGRAAEAIEAFRAAIAIEPRMAEAHLGLGNALQTVGQGAEARAALERTLALAPGLAPARHGLAAVLADLGAAEAEIEILQQLVRDCPDYAEAWNSLGVALYRQDRIDPAVAALQRAVALRPALAIAQHNLGNALMIRGEFDAALAAQERALALRPDDVATLIGVGNLQLELGRFEESAATFDRAVALAPDDPYARWNRSQLNLLRGRYRDGWADYEWRWRVRDFPGERRAQGVPAWQGEALSGRSILVWGEQGPGDEVMFASCLGDLARTGAKIALLTTPRLLALFRRSFPFADVAAFDTPDAQRLEKSSDVAIPIGSLPRHFRDDAGAFGAGAPWLVPDAAKVDTWRRRLGALGAGRKIGVSWQGGAVAIEQRRRGAMLGDWRALLRTPDAAFVNLQYGDVAGEIAALAATDGIVVHPGPDAAGDLDDYAAAIEALDMVVCMANTAAHFAGALGKPVLLLAPTVPSWRWQLEREDNPWYPTMRLVRQARGEPWPDVIARIAGRLAAEVAAGG